MASYLLASILVHTPPSGSGFLSNDVVDVYWNDSTETIQMKKNGVLTSPTSNLQIGNLNDNYYISGITSYVGEFAIAGYSFCNGADLTWFKMLQDFPMPPYMRKQVTANSPVCDVGGGVVCDIHFTSYRIGTSTTSLTNPNGTFTTTAESSNGPVKYSLSDFDYASGGQLSGSFTGLGPGLYDLYVKDENDCTLHITFAISYEPNETEHYRATWKNIDTGLSQARNERLRIYEREYVGSVVELDYADQSPFKLNKPKQGEINDKFFPIHPTSATFTPFSIKDNQFLPLATQDDKKYRVVHEVEEDSVWIEVWQGYVVPAVWKEAFLKGIPHGIEIQITDNVKLLEEEKFTDDNSSLLTGKMNLIKVISLIMKKTGLALKIRCGVNIFEINHTQNTDGSSDPFDQTYVDVGCYREGTDPFKCWDVLNAILRPFGARIYQCNNQWQIEEVDRATAEYAYRLFNTDGEYESNSTFDSIIDIKNPSQTNRAAMIGRDQNQEVIPAYGKISLITNFNYVGSIAAGGFEKEDLLSPDSEEFNISQGIFTSEESFKDWTLRLNGTTGVSFGRILTSNRGDTSRTGLETDRKDPSRSVGAFFFDPHGWSGNLRDAYLESAAKPFQYNHNDELKLFFEYSTPARPEYEFMVLRVMLKVGNMYLQQDRSWDVTEYIFRSYPPISNSLQSFELSVPVPETLVLVDTTIQMRIYYYAPGFYDYGLPTSTNDPADGQDGLADLRDFITVGVNYDYRVDVRRVLSIFSTPIAYFREFYELRVWDVAEDVDNGIVYPNDHDNTTNNKVWKGLKSINIKLDEVNMDRRGLDLKFYIDNVALDSLPNGQPPPEDETISLSISKFVKEVMEVPLYNFDAPEITNAKNMYNNYFQLEDGTPTSAWARTGINESLKIQQILLKVLASNHSAPTTRLTGSFINEFSSIDVNNYLRITEVGANLVMSNTEFDTNLDDWAGDVSGVAFIWAGDSTGGCAQVTLSGLQSSEKLYQAVDHSGGHIQVTGIVHVDPTVGNTREDQLWLLFYLNGAIIHTEKIQTFLAPQDADDYSFVYKAWLPANIDRIGFYIRRVTGSGDCIYQVTQFKPEGVDVEKIYQIADLVWEPRMNHGTFELMQMSKSYTTLAGVDQGGNGQSGSDVGNDFNGDFNNDFGADFDTILN